MGCVYNLMGPPAVTLSRIGLLLHTGAGAMKGGEEGYLQCSAGGTGDVVQS
jgi:hypothetical protein